MRRFDTYDELPGKPVEYTKRTPIKAVQMTEPFSVVTLEGEVEGKAGDWLAEGVEGELYPISDLIFQKSYQISHVKHCKRTRGNLEIEIEEYRNWVYMVTKRAAHSYEIVPVRLIIDELEEQRCNGYELVAVLKVDNIHEYLFRKKG